MAVGGSDLQVSAKKRRNDGKELNVKYILLMAGTKAGVDSYRAWSQKDIQTHFAHLKSIEKELTASGEFVAANGLGLPDRAKVVRAGKNGAPVTDGVFPEAKEFLLGYWIVDVESEHRAYEIAAKISGGPGPGGVRLDMPIEVRQVLEAKREDVV